MNGPVVLLAGGTGGAKLARGLQDHLGSDLVVVANTGDDIEIYGGYVSPDPDLICFWLADLIDDRGWGLRGDSFTVMEALEKLGEDIWFRLGDRDLAICIQRAHRLREGVTLTKAIADLSVSLGVRARVLPMTNEPVRTRVRCGGRWCEFQDFMIRGHAIPPESSENDELDNPGLAARRIEKVEFRGASNARATSEVINAIASARAIIIGPSNPVISIGPILAVPGLCEAIAQATAPVVAVSPFVRGKVVKGPTVSFLEALGYESTVRGVLRYYSGLINGFVSDERVGELMELTESELTESEPRKPTAETELTESEPTKSTAVTELTESTKLTAVTELTTNVDLTSPADRHRVAAEILQFAEALAAKRDERIVQG